MILIYSIARFLPEEER